MVATIKINRSISTDGASVSNQRRSRMRIHPQGSETVLEVPYAPREVDFDNLSSGWEEVYRAGRDSQVVQGESPRPRMSFTLYFANQSPDAPVANKLRLLSRWARGNKNLNINYSSWESGLWVVTSMGMRSIQRNSDDDEITRAEVDIEFMRVGDLSSWLGPISGGYKPGGGGGKPKNRFYVVKKGDTLMKIARKMYGNPKKWRKIAKANKITNPRRLKVGRKLKIPA